MFHTLLWSRKTSIFLCIYGPEKATVFPSIWKEADMFAEPRYNGGFFKTLPEGREGRLEREMGDVIPTVIIMYGTSPT